MVAVILVVAYALLFSPLGKIPGPFLARLTPLWLRYIDMTGNRTTTLHKLHQKYGSTILVGPNEISVNDVLNVKELYGQQTEYMKAPFYESMSMRPHGIFSLRDKVAHAQRRKLLSHAFSQSNVLESEPLIQKQIVKLLAAIERCADQPMDMLKWFRLTAHDIVGELFLGQAFGGLDSGRTPRALDDVESIFKLGNLEWNNPWIAASLHYIPFASVQHFLGAFDRMAEHGTNAFRKYVDQYGRDSGRRDLLTKILSVKPDTGVAPLTDREVSLEVGNLVSAGTDTTSTTLTFLFWELSRHQFWQKRLRDELKTHADSSITLQQVQDLPILDAVINEALRLHPAAPASLPRETPTGGRQINGYYIPEKTVVSMQCYSTQRDPEIFSEPESFKPERWMSPQDLTSEMKEMFMPFSKGTRACLGKNLAMIELKLITANIARRFEWKAAPETTEASMATLDFFLLKPVAGKCDLIFTEL
ncbi:uncharacterized protein Z520_09583 [Fonsecaea multimorphosa CBS 102226]|uniref:Cytochrome P450 monooxygenase n=1 Tax=Fonsecaea multimorphosa CBS 102226 TaxID=1442371 RepID=A0A0D2JMK4_9EURO|nr:uncharacterized protein Z520_09583 [Fonsecaea multimorphosa CBS 102226]KIX94537.1 hypothetical protein Z520_09583 [Fonsecaea multimorphosa CBS 102226]